MVLNLKVGIPKGLLFYRYYNFYITFFEELGLEIVLSPNTNKDILNEGVRYCVDEACVPMKIFHGHCAYLRDKCDFIFIPRIMKLYENEYICPKFCGLVEMVQNSIPNMPTIISEPIYADSLKSLKKWAFKVGAKFTKNIVVINKAFNTALKKQNGYIGGLNDKEFKIKVALIGHPYNLYDSYINMNLVVKLNKLGIGVITEEHIGTSYINKESEKLFKKPFWTFARNSYGFGAYMAENKLADGIIYASSFACGIDSVVVDLIKHRIEGFPFLELKIDEQTGEAGFVTRLEAFTDMLKRKEAEVI